MKAEIEIKKVLGCYNLADSNGTVYRKIQVYLDVDDNRCVLVDGKWKDIRNFEYVL